MNELTPERERMLGECLRLLDGGASLEDCLSRYPDAAGDLRPFLELRASLATAGQLDPPAGAQEQGRSRLLAQLETQGAAPASDSPWSGIKRIFSFEQRWSGALARTAAVVVAVFVLGAGALGASAAGGFEPARDALEPARDVLSALRIIPEEKKDRATPDERPTDGETDAPVISEETREPARDEPTPMPCDRLSDRPCVDEARPSPTPGRGAPVTKTPLRDARPTATPVRDAPERPIDQVATAERPLDVAPIEPPRDVEPTATSERDGEPSDRPVTDASNDTRGGEPEATIQPPEEDVACEEPAATSTPAAPALDEASPDGRLPGSIEAFDGWSGDGVREDQR